MKLLIADDEKLTREGICSLLDLKQYRGNPGRRRGQRPYRG